MFTKGLSGFKLLQGTAVIVRHITPAGGCTVEEAIKILWKIIDEAEKEGNSL